MLESKIIYFCLRSNFRDRTTLRHKDLYKTTYFLKLKMNNEPYLREKESVQDNPKCKQKVKKHC